MTIPQAASYVGVTRQYVYSIVMRFNSLSRLGNETGPFIIRKVELEEWKTMRSER